MVGAGAAERFEAGSRERLGYSPLACWPGGYGFDSASGRNSKHRKTVIELASQIWTGWIGYPLGEGWKGGKRGEVLRNVKTAGVILATSSTEGCLVHTNTGSSTMCPIIRLNPWQRSHFFTLFVYLFVFGRIIYQLILIRPNIINHLFGTALQPSTFFLPQRFPTLHLAYMVWWSLSTDRLIRPHKSEKKIDNSWC